ncbi:MAG: hypothetical protein KGL74_12240 [Elusimicrobia bacterium]|nr:hypothetical protein [Elusimicrobiota bacterium]
MRDFFADTRKAAAVVFLAALVLRLGFLWRQGPPPVLLGDAVEYHAYAVHLLDAGSYTGLSADRATRVPGYPLFLAAVFAATGRSVPAALLAQCLLGAVTCVLLMGLTSEILPFPWPVFAGLAAACYGGLVVPCAEPLSESLYSFFLVLSLRALYKSDWTPGRRALCFGALSGYLYLIRPEPLPYIAATSLLLPLLFSRFTYRDTAKALAAAALVAGLWVGRNAVVFRRLIPASTVGKSVGYLSLHLPAHRLGLAPEPRHVPSDELGELARDADFGTAYKELSGRLTWPQLARCYVFNLATILYPFLPEYDWTYVLLIPFWLIGFILAVKRKELWPMAGSVVCSLGVFTFFGGPASRYRQGIAPFFILLAAAGAWSLAERAGASKFRRWGAAWLGVNLLIWIGQSQFRDLILAVLDSAGVRGYTR